MNKDITYSFIIPHKNNPDLLQRCVNSIPRRDDIQIVVVDDNSSIDIVDWNRFKFDDERCIELIHAKGCKSAGAVRNEGLKYARGEWILFADCDDYYVKDFLNSLESYKASSFDAVYFNFNCQNENTNSYLDNVGAQLVYSQALIDIEKTDEVKYQKQPWNKMVSKRLIDSFSISFEDVIIGNDVWFSYQVGYYARKVAIIEKKLYVYTLNLKGISLTKDVNKDIVLIGLYLKQNCFFDLINHKSWKISVLGMIKYHFLHTQHKLTFLIMFLLRSRYLYKDRYKYVDNLQRDDV